MPAYVVVHLVPRRGARRARGEHTVLTRRDFKRLLLEHDAELIVVPPSLATAGHELSVTQTIAVSDMARADKLAAALRGIDGIETAYAKPGEELP